MVAGDDFAGDAEDVFAAYGAGGGVRIGVAFGADDDLDDAVAVAEVEEDQAAVVAAAVYPAAELDAASDVFSAQGAAGV